MNIAFVGLGKMGLGLAKRILNEGHSVTGYAPSESTRELAQKNGIKTFDSLKELIKNLESPKIVWLMVPAGKITNEIVLELSELLSKNDIIIDGGNSYFKDSIENSNILSKQGINFIDCGTSGGLMGEEIGYSLMIGGNREVYQQLLPIFKSVSAPDAYEYMGGSGSGHYVKMVHNGIEYGIMQAMSEGFELVKSGYYTDIDLQKVSKVWKNGSIIRSYLMDLAYNAFQKDPNLDNLSDIVDDNGMGRWTVNTAIESAIPAPAITDAVYARFRSRQESSFAGKTLAALRNEFGGHKTYKSKK